ncbi:Nramp family divalent metal transporter [Filimonas effusa]|uniref:Divalent metal cation transporter MntH n=1 Tax=Filimonas effusa TaxID=2508721 RepID=A0A4Q1D9F8_9BACT|nr:Nramp family divalent metal transporter [Filimonas effusa]RXK85335.1 iron/manganese transporter [Filimonas effusa]
MGSFSGHSSDHSLSDVHESVDTTKPRKGLRRFLAFAGPAYLVSVGYMDPGNWATDLQGGAQFGYQLIWVLLMSNLMALLLQGLSARLGIVRRRDLAQANRETYPPLVNFCLYILAELAIAACDLAEVLGMAIGIQLLTGLPVLYGVLFTVLDTFLLFYLQKLGIRKMEAFIIALVGVIGLSFLVQLIIAKPHMGDVVKGFVPTALNNEALYIAVGIIGATVMPHNLYLHSALVQTRKIGRDSFAIKQALRFNLADSAVALNAAFLVNAAILILAASVFHTSGNTSVASLEDAHRLLEPMLGSTLAPALFAIALIAAGQSSTVTGTLAGQIVMEGYLQLRINPLLRRLLTRLIAIVPAVLVILIYGDQELDALLVLSQVILSLQLGFAIIPLIHFVSDKKTMGEFVIRWHVKVAAWIVTAVLIFLNVNMVLDQARELFASEGRLVQKSLTIAAGLVFSWLFIMMTFLPFIQRRRARQSAMHGESKPLTNLAIPAISKIAIALDFGGNDEKLIAHAISQGDKRVSYLLLHIVETVSARYLGAAADDEETRKDQQRLHYYASQLQALGYEVETALGYKDRVNEIVRLVKTSDAGLLVMGAHRHTGLKDFLYGATVDQVRHKLVIPILIVN